MSNIFERLEKTANEAYPEEGRINRGFLAETFLGSGPVGYYAKKNNTLGVNEDDSHTMANAKVNALTNGVIGGATGGFAGAMTAPHLGKSRVGLGLVGGLAGAAYGGALGGLSGAGYGLGHDAYDKHLRQKANKETGMTQTAGDILDRLEKTANEAYPEEGRINRGLAAETFLGSGPLGYYAKKNNALGVDEDDSHLVANAKINAMQSAGMGGLTGALGGAIAAPLAGRSRVTGGLVGAAQGAAINGLTGGIFGGANGFVHDAYDKHLRRGANNTSNEPAGMAQTAGDIFDRLEKTAKLNAKGKVLKYFDDVSGQGVRRADDAFSRKGDDYRARKAIKARDDRNKAQGYTAGALGGAGLGAAGIAAAKKKKEDETEEKTASAEFMSELYKEAASEIVETTFPSVKEITDPIHRIKFDR